MLLSALELLNADGETAARHRVAAMGDDLAPRQLAHAVLRELLPLDDERRRRYTVHAAYFVRFLTDPELARTVENQQDALAELVAGILADGTPDQETIADATLLVATAIGLQTQMLLGQLSPETADQFLDRALDRVRPTIRARRAPARRVPRAHAITGRGPAGGFFGATTMPLAIAGPPSVSVVV